MLGCGFICFVAQIAVNSGKVGMNGILQTANIYSKFRKLMCLIGRMSLISNRPR